MRETWMQSLGWEDSLRRKWQLTPVFLPGEFYGQRSLAGYSPWGHRARYHGMTCTFTFMTSLRGFPGGSVVKNPSASARAAGETGSIPGLGRSPGGGDGSLLQSHGLENSTELTHKTSLQLPPPIRIFILYHANPDLYLKVTFSAESHFPQTFMSRVCVPAQCLAQSRHQ